MTDADVAERPRRGLIPHRELTKRRIASRREPSKRERRVLGATGVIVVLGLWELLSQTGVIDPLLASSPSAVATTAVDLIKSGELPEAMVSSARLFAIGFGISLTAGLAIGLVLGWYKRAEALFDPLVSLLYATPNLALMPLITVWFGIGMKAQIVVVILISIFPIIISTAAGVGSIDRDHLRVAQSFLATNRDVLVTVALPGAVRPVVAGIRQGLILALIGVIVGEYFFGNTGVGGMIFTAGIRLDTSEAFVGAAVFAITALILTSTLRALERRLDTWRI